MEMFHQASMKLGLDRAVLAHARIEQGDDGEGESVDMKLSLKEIDALLKRGAYDVFREDDSEQKEFEEADIDSILQRRAHKVVYNEGATSISSLGNFSKASFVSADEKEDVDINDPDFWKKAIGLKDEAGGELNEPEEVIVLNTQRKRKQTTVYGDMQNEDEEDFKRALKQSRNGKIDKNEKLALKAAQKEQQLKERQERDEARKAKILEEIRLKNDPKTWGPHGRDRILRALNMFGSGRWNKIKSETGKEMMGTKDLEAFCNYYIYQCGLCAGEQQESNKTDTSYVMNVIREAKEIEHLTQIGKKKLIDFPICLSEPRFLIKLKTGLAKKSLNKLDVLTKLIHLMHEVCRSLAKSKDISIEELSSSSSSSSQQGSLDIDKISEQFTIEELISALPFGDIRPPWARSCPWWDLDCDKHLIVGIFKHGYGQYDVIKDDENFIFKRKLAENLAKATAASKLNNNMSSQNLANQDEKNHDDDVDEAEGVVKFQGDIDMMMDDDDQVLMEKIDDGDDGDDDNINVHSSGTGKSGAHNTQPGCMPDPRHLNRIISWLVTADMARMTHDEVMEKDKSRRGRHSESGNRRGMTDTPTLDENGPNLDQGPITIEKLAIDNFKLEMDVDSMSLVYKPQVSALRICSTVLPLATSENKQEDQSSPMDIDIEGNSKNLKTDSPIDEPIVTHVDAMKLSAAFILHGAPIDCNQYYRVYSVAKEIFGIERENIDRMTYSWNTVKTITDVSLTDQHIEVYYKTVWIPFCQQLISPQTQLSLSSDQFIPSPLKNPSDHSNIARGLCQVFLLRQQLMYAINRILTFYFRSLSEYLRDMRGRAVDNMPVWWCPWIHDLGLLLGILKHGYLATDKIFTDPELPFHRDYLNSFVRKVFLIGSERTPGVGKFDFRTTEEAERFVAVSVNHYPDMRDLETRIFRIVEDMTSHLPMEHPCRITIPFVAMRTIINQASVSASEEQSKMKSDSKVSRNILRGPAVSLNAFVNTSRKRRKAYVVSYHPELTCEK